MDFLRKQSKIRLRGSAGFKLSNVAILAFFTIDIVEAMLVALVVLQRLMIANKDEVVDGIRDFDVQFEAFSLEPPLSDAMERKHNVENGTCILKSLRSVGSEHFDLGQFQSSEYLFISYYLFAIWRN